MKNIMQWAKDDRPREKMQSHGARSLTDSELLAIVLGSGTKEVNALELGRQLLGQVDHALIELSRKGVDEFMEIKGVGAAKATKLSAVFELARRISTSEKREITTVTSSRHAYEILRAHLQGLMHEEFFTILLNRGNKVLSVERISSGGLSGTVADGKVIYRKALLKQSTALILAHNHPSGNLRPSQADLNLTKKLKEFGEMVGFQVLDHLIISDNGYLSFADEGLI